MSKETESLLLRIQHLECIVQEFVELLENSDGVAGIHLNGEIATWEELRSIGWLGSLDGEIGNKSCLNYFPLGEKK